MSSLFSCSSKQLQGTRGTRREGTEHSGSLEYIFTCSSSSSKPRANLHLRRGGKRYPFGLCWMVFWGLVYISFFKEVFIFWQFSICFSYKQNLCWRSLTPTDLLGLFARGRINPESGDWWDFLFPVPATNSEGTLPLFPHIFTSIVCKVLFSLIICLLTSGFLPWSFPLLFHILILLKTHPNLQAAPTANLHFWVFFSVRYSLLCLSSDWETYLCSLEIKASAIPGSVPRLTWGKG